MIDGRIKPGEGIKERNYAEKFNMSRTPVREALRKLEMEGLVEYLPRRGVIASQADYYEQVMEQLQLINNIMLNTTKMPRLLQMIGGLKDRYQPVRKNTIRQRLQTLQKN